LSLVLIVGAFAVERGFARQEAHLGRVRVGVEIADDDSRQLMRGFAYEASSAST